MGWPVKGRNVLITKHRHSNENFDFSFLPAIHCNAETLASVYDTSEQGRQVSRIRSLLAHQSSGRNFFVLAEYNEQPAALLYLCQEHNKTYRFRIRGLHTHRRFRNQGLATRLLQFGTQCIFRHHGREIVSYILPTNAPSITAHQRAGFIPCTPHLLQPERHRCFIVSASLISVCPEMRIYGQALTTLMT